MSHSHHYMVGVGIKMTLILKSKSSCLSPYRLNLVACVCDNHIRDNESVSLLLQGEINGHMYEDFY